MSDLEQRLRKAVRDGMEGAGSLPAKDSVKVVPRDWHKMCDAITEAADRLRQYREALEYYAKWHPQPSEGPWGADSTDFGEIARIALKETTDVD